MADDIPGIDLGESEDIIVIGGDDTEDFTNNAKYSFNHRLPDGSIVNIDPLADIIKSK